MQKPGKTYRMWGGKLLSEEAIAKAQKRNRDKLAEKRKIKKENAWLDPNHRTWTNLSEFTPEEKLAHRRKCARRWIDRAKENNPVRFQLMHKKCEAARLGVAFNLTEDWFIAHFSQGCEATGVDMNFEKGSPLRCEIDRIKCGGDYTMDNCRLVCAIYNRARMNWGDEPVAAMAKNLVEWSNGK